MITVKEIARLAGVSAKTAERALSGVTKDKRRDARERAERVRKIAEAHGYRPSELALALRRGSIRTIGFVSDILTDQFIAAAVETAIDEAARQNYKVALQVVRFDKEQTLEAVKSLLAAGTDGIITSCCSDQLPSLLMHTLEEQQYPIFTLCGQSNYNFSSVAADYSEALPQAVESLSRKGHKKVTFCLFCGKDIDNSRSRKIFFDLFQVITEDYNENIAKIEAARKGKNIPVYYHVKYLNQNGFLLPRTVLIAHAIGKISHGEMCKALGVNSKHIGSIEQAVMFK